MTRLGREVAVLGVGMTRFAKYPDTTADMLAAQAIREALADAGLDWKDMQAMASAQECAHL